MSSFALLIGLNYSTANNQLYGCINDCIRMRNILVIKYGFAASNIMFMRDDIYNNSHPLYPNKTNILIQLSNLFALSKTTGTLLYFHYSGHGSYIEDNNDETNGFNEFIVPADYFINGSKIIDDELLTLTLNLNPSVPCFMVFDSCYRGSILDLNWRYTYNKSNGLYIQTPGNKTVSNIQNSIICISRCTDGEISRDVLSSGKYNGALSNGLYDTLSQKLPSQTISVGLLVANIYKYFTKNVFKQNPIISTQLPLDVNTVAFLKTTLTIRDLFTEKAPVVEKEPITEKAPVTNIFINFGSGNIDLSAPGFKTTIKSNLTVDENMELTGNLVVNGANITSTNIENAINLFNTTIGDITFGNGNIDLSAPGCKTTVSGDLVVNGKITGNIYGSASTVSDQEQLNITRLGTLTTLNVDGPAEFTSINVGGSSLSFTSHSSNASIIGGNHIVNATGITLSLDTTDIENGTFNTIYNPSHSYILKNNNNDSFDTIDANRTTVCIYTGENVWVAYSNGVALKFSLPL